MRHAREDYNGRVVDLLEAPIMAAVLAARLGLTQAADAATVAGNPEAAERYLKAEAMLAEQLGQHSDSTAHAIPADEPVFLLRGQDITASYVVDHWASKNAARSEGDTGLIDSARIHAARMRGWPVQKVADA